MSDEELMDAVEELVGNYFANTYISLQQRSRNCKTDIQLNKRSGIVRQYYQ